MGRSWAGWAVWSTLLLGCVEPLTPASSVGDPADADAAVDASASGLDADAADAGDVVEPGDAADTADAEPLPCPAACAAHETCKGGVCVDRLLPCKGRCLVSSIEYCAFGLAGEATCATSGCKQPGTTGAFNQIARKLVIAPADQGCDLNGDGTSDNAIGSVSDKYPSFNSSLQAAVESGAYAPMFAADSVPTTSADFDFSVLIGHHHGQSEQGCAHDYSTPCTIWIDKASYKGGPTGLLCEPKAPLSGKLFANGELRAEPVDTATVRLHFSFLDGFDVEARIHRVEGTYLQTEHGPQIHGGRVCMSVSAKDVETALNAVAPAEYAKVGLAKEVAIGAFLVIAKPDVDHNKDGFADAISVAVFYETMAAVP
ncbi:MAG: hypothetical protein H6747_10775 [Deltaproteobacteria bacterium]|nr:hypothetical protein [Deltaproteobacteria bacterium]